MSEPVGGNPYRRPAYGITELFDNVNTLAPNRSKATDGILGDQAHAAHESGHNPNSRGDVCAGDITQDPAHGADGHKISEAIRLSKDERVLYVIFDRHIFDGPEGTQPFVWRPYNGASPHTDHVHVSLRQDPRYYDDKTPWQIGDDMTSAEVEAAVEAAVIKVLTTAKIVPIPAEAKPAHADDKTTVVNALLQDWGHDLRDEAVDRAKK